MGRAGDAFGPLSGRDLGSRRGGSTHRAGGPALANALILDTWTGTDVRMGQVTDMLTRLRNAKARRASRTSVMTLIVDAMTEDEARRSAVAMRALGGHHPARLITVRPAFDSDRVGVDAR